MSWDELQIFGATFFAEQISSVVKGGDRLLRQRLGELGPNERAASDARRSPSPSLFDLGYARLLLRLWFSRSDSQTTQTVWLDRGLLLIVRPLGACLCEANNAWFEGDADRTVATLARVRRGKPVEGSRCRVPSRSVCCAY
jgi:hypothetical protein